MQKTEMVFTILPGKILIQKLKATVMLEYGMKPIKSGRVNMSAFTTTCLNMVLAKLVNWLQLQAGKNMQEIEYAGNKFFFETSALRLLCSLKVAMSFG